MKRGPRAKPYYVSPRAPRWRLSEIIASIDACRAPRYGRRPVMARPSDPAAPSETETPMGTLLRVREAAEQLSCSISTIRRLIAQKKLPATASGAAFRIAEADLERVLRPVR